MHTRLPHKDTCQCLPCLNKRGDPHKNECMCIACRSHRGEYRPSEETKQKQRRNRLPREIRVCLACQKSFEVSINSDHKVCSKECGWVLIGRKNSEYRRTKETRQKISLALGGTGIPGEKTKLVELVRNLPEFDTWRKSVFDRDGYACQDCGKVGNDLEPHHIKLFYVIFLEFLQEYNQFSMIDDKETLIRLAMNYKPFWEVSNGKTLCHDCHHNKGLHKGRRIVATALREIAETK